MKLELIKKYEPDNIQFFLGSCAVLNDETAIFLIIDKTENYSLLAISPDEMKSLPLNYIERFADDKPVLFAKDGGFGIIKNQHELFYYPTMESEPTKIKIDNKRLFQHILPPTTRLRSPNPISNGDTIPVCFGHTTSSGHESRYFAFLNLNIGKQKAKWESWAELDDKKLPIQYDKKPPKLDSVMIKNDDVFVFTSGSKITSVNKWGMDYYGIAKITKQGEITQILLDSGSLGLIDEKKRGVNGIFSSSGQYTILTPVFQSDEWKGKQKLFSMETNELIDIEFPRGFGKRPQITQHSKKYFWVYLRDTKHIAICGEINTQIR